MKFTITCHSCKSTDVDTGFDYDGTTTISCNACDADVHIGNWFDESEKKLPFDITCNFCGSLGEVSHFYMNTDDTGPVGGSEITCTSCKAEYTIMET